MIPVDQARDLVRARARPLAGVETVPLAAAAGRVLADPVAADRDDPPFDRSMMDGFAVRADDVAASPCALEVVGRVAAGDRELPRVGAGQAAWINTGAPLPPGADAVVPVEKTRGEVEVLVAVATGANVLPRGALVKAGEEVAAGRLRPETIAVCAAVGADPVAVRRRPRVAMFATGSELEAAPGPHQIRNSNGPLLRALLAPVCEVEDLGVAGDTREAHDAAFAEALAADVVVTTGGVSKGELDLVRPVLEARGVEVVFHGVALQPGKPCLFGVHGGGAAFGLPGNPASALVCAELFLLPFLAVLGGRGFDDVLRARRGRLSAAVQASPSRRRVFPCVRDGDAVHPLPWRSSADLYTLAKGNGYVVIEPGQDRAPGDDVTCLVPERFGAA